MGYSALMTVLNEIWFKEVAAKKKATREAFLPIAEKLRTGLGGKPIVSTEFGSSEQGAKTLATTMLSGLNDA